MKSLEKRLFACSFVLYIVVAGSALVEYAPQSIRGTSDQMPDWIVYLVAFPAGLFVRIPLVFVTVNAAVFAWAIVWLFRILTTRNRA